jgi:hypothetical protein
MRQKTHSSHIFFFSPAALCSEGQTQWIPRESFTCLPQILRPNPGELIGHPKTKLRAFRPPQWPRICNLNSNFGIRCHIINQLSRLELKTFALELFQVTKLKVTTRCKVDVQCAYKHNTEVFSRPIVAVNNDNNQFRVEIKTCVPAIIYTSTLTVKVKVKLSRYRPSRPLEIRNVKPSGFSRLSAL